MADALDDLAQGVAKLGDHAQTQALYRRALATACEFGQAEAIGPMG